MPDELSELRVELRVLASEVAGHQKVADNRHLENKASLRDLEQKATENRHGINNVNTKIDDLNVKLTGWPYEEGRGGIKGDLTLIRSNIEQLPAMLAMQRSAGLWNSLGRGGKAVAVGVLIGLLTVVIGAVVVASLAIGGAHP